MINPKKVYLSHTGELRQYPEGNSYVVAAERAVTRAGHAITDTAFFSAVPILGCLLSKRTSHTNAFNRTTFSFIRYLNKIRNGIVS